MHGSLQLTEVGCEGVGSFCWCSSWIELDFGAKNFLTNELVAVKFTGSTGRTSWLFNKKNRNNLCGCVWRLVSVRNNRHRIHVNSQEYDVL